MRDTQKDFHNKVLGKKGERRAVRYLKKRGFRILERNCTTPFGEADIVARDGEDYVFIEVKTRSSDWFGEPKDAVDKGKQARYRKIAAYYLRDAENSYIRFDVVEVSEKEVVQHIENAF